MNKQTQFSATIRLRNLFLLAALVSGIILPHGAMLAAAPGVVVVPGSSDNFYKLAVSETGMVAVTHAALAAAGVPVATLDPGTFRIFEQGTEISRRVVDADGSGTFNAGDAILFYGRSVNTYFTGTNIYWLTFGTGPGLEMATRDASPVPGLTPVTDFLETLHLEQDLRWMKGIPLTGVADRWYWALYQTRCSATPAPVPGRFTTTVNTPGVAAGAFTATLTPRLRGFNEASHTAILTLNGTAIGTATFASKDEFLGSFSFNQSLLVDSNTLELTAPCPTTTTTDWGLVNWFELSYHRSYAAPGSGQFHFAVDAATPSAVKLTGIASDTTAVYDITDPLHPVHLTGVQTTAGLASNQISASGVAAFELSFAHTLSAVAHYVAAAPSQWRAPGSIALDTPSQLRSPSEGADWIAITPATFRSQAERLAAHRNDYQGFRTAVVDVQDVYDEFNGGLMDQQAIRAFLRHAYESWPRPAPRYVVLLGDGHYDARDRLGTHTPNPIPPYLASVNPFDGVMAADNRYVAYDPVPPALNPPPFMSLGRLPANTLADAQGMVDKIIAYESTPVHADWNRDVLFVADNNDASVCCFDETSDLVADSTSYLPATYDREKVYYGTNYTSGTAATDAIVSAVNRGALFVNYHGHASVQNWAGDPVLLTLSDQSRLNNTGKYPIFLPMTCLEGDFTDPYAGSDSFGESIVRKPNAGAVASWSPTGKGVAKGHETIYTAFYEAIFQQGITEIGPATTYAKQALNASSSAFKDLLDTYILFGDPATRLDLPGPDVWVQKSAAPASPWQAGQAVTYTLTYGNSGVTVATGVRLTDTLPAGLTGGTWTASDPAVTDVPGQTFAWQLPDLAPGATGTLTLRATVEAGLPAGMTITNTATIATSAGERPVVWPNNAARVGTSIQTPQVALGGHTFVDVDADGTYEPGYDQPLSGVTVTVRDSNGAIVASPLSDSQGEWATLLVPATYSVSAPLGFGAYGRSTPSPVSVTVAPGSSPAVDFGYAAPTGLEIEYLRARWLTAGARVEWATRTETSVTGFNLYRTTDPTVWGKKLNPDTILPKAPPGEGAAYRYDDTDVLPGPGIYYWLEAATETGIVWIGPVTPGWAAVRHLPLVNVRK